MLAALPYCIRLACLGLLCGTALHGRTWTDTLGRTLEAELVSTSASEVTVRRPDGRTVSLQLALLSAADQDFVRLQAASPTATPQHGEPPVSTAPLATATTVAGVDFNMLNTLLGLPLLADESLWDDSPAEVAQRLQLSVEGKNAYFEGFRSYHKPARAVLGAGALMISLQAVEGRVTSIMLQFANRGDFPGFQHCVADRGQPTAAELKAFDKTLKIDFAALTAGLTAKLGEPNRERALFGGLDSGRLSLRWEWHGLALLASQDPGQMVLLKIIP